MSKYGVSQKDYACKGNSIEIRPYRKDPRKKCEGSRDMIKIHGTDCRSSHKGCEPNFNTREDKLETARLKLEVEKLKLEADRLRVNQTKVEAENPVDESILCKVCFTGAPNMAIVPCGHAFCGECITSFKDCPICRGSVTSLMKIYQ